MRIRAHWQALALAAVSFAATGSARAQGALDLGVTLPATESWTQISDRTSGLAYSQEWIPEGDDADEPSWLITNQKVPIDRNMDADAFLRTIYDMAGEVCKSATNDEITRHRIGELRGAVGRTQCGQRVDGNYGTFTDRLVIVDNGFAYVVTSELRTPPMLVDGILAFGRGDEDASGAARRQFVEREALSREFIRDGVSVE
jgi:hypothetical protein